jgi:thiamine-phosphate pyrophosphorylase
VLLYAITDRRLCGSPEALIEQAILWARNGVDFIQIREKDLAAADLSALAEGIVSAVRAAGGSTRILLNGPADIAARAGCDGVHLTANMTGIAITDAKAALDGSVSDPVVSISCHTLSHIQRARDYGATLTIFAPIFEKQAAMETLPGQGLDALADACRIAGPMPVFALGGVTARNAQDCIRAGAAGIAAIRLFASDAWRDLLK